MRGVLVTTFALADAVSKIDKATDLLTGELDRIIGRMFRADAQLWLDYDVSSPAQAFVVKDGGNGDEPMARCASIEAALTWMRLFVARTPGATFDDFSVEQTRRDVGRAVHSARVDVAEVIPIRRGVG